MNNFLRTTIGTHDTSLVERSSTRSFQAPPEFVDKKKNSAVVEIRDYTNDDNSPVKQNDEVTDKGRLVLIKLWYQNTRVPDYLVQQRAIKMLLSSFKTPQEAIQYFEVNHIGTPLSLIKLWNRFRKSSDTFIKDRCCEMLLDAFQTPEEMVEYFKAHNIECR